ncbi:MAG: hypothetical protein HY814_13900 [Candidatus Riflebacteria bacterium]|nr:hypothetical protein [Candidatus Riflebacteria bacterium]
MGTWRVRGGTAKRIHAVVLAAVALLAALGAGWNAHEARADGAVRVAVATLVPRMTSRVPPPVPPDAAWIEYRAVVTYLGATPTSTPPTTGKSDVRVTVNRPTSDMTGVETRWTGTCDVFVRRAADPTREQRQSCDADDDSKTALVSRASAGDVITLVATLEVSSEFGRAVLLANQAAVQTDAQATVPASAAVYCYGRPTVCIGA